LPFLLHRHRLVNLRRYLLPHNFRKFFSPYHIGGFKSDTISTDIVCGTAYKSDVTAQKNQQARTTLCVAHNVLIAGASRHLSLRQTWHRYQLFAILVLDGGESPSLLSRFTPRKNPLASIRYSDWWASEPVWT
jgi:hypothetical protein